MQYRLDGKSGRKLSALGFGCMRFPRDRAKTESLILTAIDRGVNYFDTAYIYGNSETVLGEILQKHSLREKIFLATKLPFGQCKVYEDFERLFQRQLSRLQTDYIDYYLIHNISEVGAWQRLAELGIEKWIAEKKAAGQIRELGFSFHGDLNGFLELVDVYDWDFCQIQYNYMDENYQAGKIGLKRAYEKGLPVIIMEPLLGGRLANGLPRKTLNHFREADSSVSPAQWALRWLWNQPEVTVVLSGMNAMEQLEDNLKAAECALPGMLTEKEKGVFVPVIAAIREAYKIPCTGCNYCLPCPHGVNIPGCFAAYNTSFAMGRATGIQQYVVGTKAYRPLSSGENRTGKNCVRCGLCEKKCPQHIAIMQELPRVTKRIEPAPVRAALWVAGKVMK